MASLDGVSPTSAIAPIADLRVHAPNDAIAERFWQQQQNQARASEGQHPHGEAGAAEASAIADARATDSSVISQVDTLKLGCEEHVDNPFVSLIEHQLHLHLPVESEALDAE